MKHQHWNVFPPFLTSKLNNQMIFPAQCLIVPYVDIQHPPKTWLLLPSSNVHLSFSPTSHFTIISLQHGPTYRCHHITVRRDGFWRLTGCQSQHSSGQFSNNHSSLNFLMFLSRNTVYCSIPLNISNSIQSSWDLPWPTFPPKGWVRCSSF